MTVCLSLELVTRYMAGDCTKAECEEVEVHMAQCKACRERTKSGRSYGSTLEAMDRSRAKDCAAAGRGTGESLSSHDEHPTKSMEESMGPGAVARAAASVPELVFAGYKILGELPRGGQAVVYKAIHLATKTKVALKVLLPSLLPSARARRNFEREAELIATLDHPNIVKIRDSGITHGQYFFTMEYVRGEPLEKYVGSGNLSFRERILLFKKVCAAVAYAHQRGIMHRDLKSNNILVDDRGEPHILDFGLAKVAGGLGGSANDGDMPTMTGQWSGSLQYMSPEQASGRPDLLDVRTDVFSLGVILYRMCTGRFPFEFSGTLINCLENIQKADPIKPSGIARRIDRDLETILLTALAKDLTRRYQSAFDLQNDIDNWLDQRPIRVRSSSTTYLLRKILAKHRYATAVVVLLFLIVIGFACVTYDLFLTARESQLRSEAAADQLAVEVTSKVALARQVMFSLFLEAWHAGRDKRAVGIANALRSENSREFRGVAFLLDARPLVEKEERLRRLLVKHPGFVEFIVAEHHLKKGYQEQAIAAYRRSSDATIRSVEEPSAAAGWLAGQVRVRIAELTGGDISAGNTCPISGNK